MISRFSLADHARAAIVAGCWITFISGLNAATAVSYHGSLNPDDPNTVYQVSVTLAKPGPLIVQSYGYGGTANALGAVDASGTAVASGGFDPYISLFQGVGSSATFLASNDDGVCPPGSAAPLCHDSSLALMLPAGSYIVVLSAFENMSFAENLGTGTLGDGFIGLGNYFYLPAGSLRTPTYAFDVKTPIPVSDRVSVTQTGFGRNRLTGLWAATLTVTNTSSSTIGRPIQVALTNVSANASMMNETGIFFGNPYITVSGSDLKPGASASVSIQFSNPSNGYISYAPMTYSGIF